MKAWVEKTDYIEPETFILLIYYLHPYTMPYCKHCNEYIISSIDYHECPNEERVTKNSPDSIIVSTIIGAATDSALLGGLLGGSMVGGILGDALDGDLFD